MSKSSKTAIWIVLAVPLLTAPLWADGIINGGISGVAITPTSITLGSGTQAAPSLTFSADTTTGWYRAGATQWNWASANVNYYRLTTTGVELSGSPATGLLWGSGDGNSTPDTGFSRSGAASVSVGNGTVGNASGGINMALLSTTGSVTHQNLVTGTNADFLCLATNGSILIQTTACTISSLRFKPDWKPYADNALTKVSRLEVGTFHTEIPNNDPNWQTKQAGLNAENIAKIAPECAVYENDMKTPKSYRQECVIALLVRAIQQLEK